MKTCSYCGEEKDDTLFRVGRNQCLECYKQYLKNYRQQNEQELKRKRDEDYQNNPEKKRAINKRSYENHKEDRLARNNKYYAENQEELVLYQRNYRANNSELIAAYHRNRYQEDLQYRLKILVKSAIRRCLKNKEGKSVKKYLPYSIQELKEHLETQFESWMTWNNQGRYEPKTWNDNVQTTWTWNIDHIIPHSDLPYSSMEDDNFKKCWALSNLRPLSSKQNLLDGSKRTRHR